MSTVKRITLSLPVELYNDLEYVHRRIGVSRSAFVSSIMVAGVRDLRALLEALPERPTAEDIVRFRGNSISLVEDRVEEAMELIEKG